MNTTITQYKNWQVSIDADQIAWLYLDCPGSVNKLGLTVINELGDIIDQIDKQSDVRGVIIASAKTSGFIAGADIEQFTTFKSSEEAMVLINKGHEVFKQIEALKIPSVAMIKGFCLGGGFELSLACRYRVADEGLSTKLGLPEILLGIHPGWGGCVRLPRLIGAIQAMDMILSGRTVNARAAAAMGIVDAAVPDRHLVRAARSFILEKPQPHQATALQNLTNHYLVRPLLAQILRKKVMQKARPEHYPAPYAVIDNWVKYGVEYDALQIEADSLGKIAMTDTARNLVRVFFLQERLKGLGKNIKFKPLHIHVIGAGTMGGDIASWCALRGFNVTLQDREAKFIAPAIKRAYDLYKKKLKQPRAIRAAMDRLMPDIAGTGIAKADVIIEAIFENLEVKQALFKDLEMRAKPDAVLATNTSSIPLDEINSVMKDPSRLVGIHFFNPVSMMQLVEVVKGKHSSQEMIDKATAFVRQIDRLPLPVKSSPGFLVNRALMPYLMEAMALLEEGVSPIAIDKAATRFGMPMGPIELADTVGLDVCLAVGKNLASHFGGDISSKLEDMVSKGLLGRKTGKGFYTYKNGKPVKDSKDTAANGSTKSDLADRMIMRMINEAVACLREQVVADKDLLDAGMIFGTGFAPFRGGPMNYLYTRGVSAVYEQMQSFYQQYGERFKPDQGWDQLLLPGVKDEIKNSSATVSEATT